MDRNKLDTYMWYIKQKFDFNQTKNQSWNNPTTYMQGIQDELEEVKVEFEANNTIYLEDELGDILRDYLNLLHTLERNGKIRSVDHVISHSLTKYSERVTNHINWIDRKDTKNKQKKELEQDYINYQDSL